DVEFEYVMKKRAERRDEKMLRKLEESGSADDDDDPFFPYSGLTAVSSKGTSIMHPLVIVRNEAWKRVLKAAAEFGMTPSSRTRIELPVGAGRRSDDPWEGLAERAAARRRQA